MQRKNWCNLLRGFRSNFLKAPSLVFLFFSLLMQRSDAQGEPSLDSPLPGYDFRVALPAPETSLTLPELPPYDQENAYLRVRDSSKDWYQDSPPGEPTPLLDANQRILPDIQSEDVWLDTRFVPIPRASAEQRFFPENLPNAAP